VTKRALLMTDAEEFTEKLLLAVALGKPWPEPLTPEQHRLAQVLPASVAHTLTLGALLVPARLP
jgi:hypothetical protein